MLSYPSFSSFQEFTSKTVPYVEMREKKQY